MRRSRRIPRLWASSLERPSPTVAARPGARAERHESSKDLKHAAAHATGRPCNLRNESLSQWPRWKAILPSRT